MSSKQFNKDLNITSTRDASSVSIGSLSTLGGANIAKKLLIGSTYSTPQLGATTGAFITLVDNVIVTDTTSISNSNVPFWGAFLGNPTIAAVNTGVVYPTAATLYIDAAPTAGNNVTLQNPWSIFVSSGNVFFGNNLAIRTSSSTQALDVNGNINFTGNLYQNGSVYSGSTQWGSTGANIYFNSGNVGINTTAPIGILDISRDWIGNGYAADSGQLIIRGKTNSNKAIGLAIDTTNNIGVICAQLTGSSTYPLCLNPNGGNIGIGTTSPSRPLEVRTGSNTYGIRHSDGTIRLDTYLGGSINGAYIGTQSQHPLGFMTNDSQALMTIQTNGNVGIATTSPSAKLHIYESTGASPGGNSGSIVISRGNTGGNSSITFTSTINAGSDYGYIRYIDSVTSAGYTGYNYFNSSNSEAAALVIGCENDSTSGSGPDSVIISPVGNVAITPGNGTTYISGNVGIGTTAPSTILHVARSGTTNTIPTTGLGGSTVFSFMTNEALSTPQYGLIAGVASSNGLSWLQSKYSGNTSTLPIALNPLGGYVGIGTTNPSYTLDVNGSIRTNSDILLDSASRLTLFNNTGPFQVRSGGSNTLFLNQDNNGNVSLVVGGGSVGIGTSAPGYKLDVTGGKLGVNSTSTTDGNIVYSNTIGGGVVVFADTSHSIWGRRGYDGVIDQMQFREYGQIQFWTGGGIAAQTKQLTITSNGNILIAGAANNNTGINMPSTGYGIHWGSGYSRIYDDGDLRICTDDTMHFYTGSTTLTPGTERMSITSTGIGVGINNQVSSLCVNGNASGNGALQVLAISSTINGGKSQDCISTKAWNDGNYIIDFYNSGGTLRGSIQGNGASAVTYNTSSDRRLKKNVTNMNSTINLIKQIRPVTFTWTTDNKNDFGFIAQEIYELFPGMRPNLSSYSHCECNITDISNGILCNCEEHDHDEPVNKDGNPLYYGLDYGRFTPYLTKALQETITELESTQQTVQNQESIITELQSQITAQQQQINDILTRIG